MSARIAVVGPCASGKSTLVERLQARGLDAYGVAQEHSVISKLWQHRNPEIVVYLDVSLETIRTRREKPDWPEWLYEQQSQRLEDARSNADLVLDADHLSPTEEEQAVVDWIEGQHQ